MTKNRFKAGDVVRAVCNMDGLRVGEEYTVEATARPTTFAWIMLRGQRNPGTNDGSYQESHFGPAWGTQPAGLQIEGGKFYRTADGAKVGPMQRWSTEAPHCWRPAPLEQRMAFSPSGDIWKSDGTSDYAGVPTLVAEWPTKKAQPGDRMRMLHNDGAGGYKAGDHFVTPDGESFVDNDGDKRPLDLHPHEVVGAPAAAFKVGDRVRFTDKCPRTWWFGPHTKHKEGVITADEGGGTYDVVVPSGLATAHILSPYQIEPAPRTPTAHAIVAAIENGKPKPAHRPVVHPDRATAAKEAQRLARVHPGKEFGVYELAETRSTAAPKHEWQRLAAAGRRAAAVSELMRVAGVAAPSAFSAVDRFRNAA